MTNNELECCFCVVHSTLFVRDNRLLAMMSLTHLLFTTRTNEGLTCGARLLATSLFVVVVVD